MSAVSRMELAAEVPLVFSGVMRLIWGGGGIYINRPQVSNTAVFIFFPRNLFHFQTVF